MKGNHQGDNTKSFLWKRFLEWGTGTTGSGTNWYLGQILVRFQLNRFIYIHHTWKDILVDVIKQVRVKRVKDGQVFQWMFLFSFSPLGLRTATRKYSQEAGKLILLLKSQWTKQRKMKGCVRNEPETIEKCRGICRARANPFSLHL